MSDVTTYDNLKAEFSELLSAPLVIEPEPDPSFLKISGFPHYEEVISNWYAFFFDSDAPHGLKTLFIDSLVEMINASGKLAEISAFDKCQAKREHAVKEKSIDIVLYDEAAQESKGLVFKNAIVIENKINASLYNDLDLYFANVSAEQSKAGVLLSLQPHAGIPGTYVNILHKDLIAHVLTNLGKYMFRANSKYLLLLKDFVQQIQLFTKTDSMKEYVNFYFEHAEKINQLNQVRNKAMDALLNELNMAFESTPFKWGRRYPESLNIRYEHGSNVLLILQLSSLFDHAKYKVELWFTYDLAPKWRDQAFKSQVLATVPTLKGFTFKTDRSGQKYSWIGTQEMSFERSLEEINQWPLRFAEDLRINWYPFIQQLVHLFNT